MSSSDLASGRALISTGHQSGELGADLTYSWTSKDPRESLLYSSSIVKYQFHTIGGAHGKITTLIGKNGGADLHIAKFEWAADDGLGRVYIGNKFLQMADLVRPDPSHPGARTFDGPDGFVYRWQPSNSNSDIQLLGGDGIVKAYFRPEERKETELGDVYGELYFLSGVGSGSSVTWPPLMDMATSAIMLYRYCEIRNL